MYIIKNANSKNLKINGIALAGSLISGSSPSDVTVFTEDAKQYKSRKGARVAVERLNSEINRLVKKGKLSSRAKNVEDALPDYIIVEPKGKRM